MVIYEVNAAVDASIADAFAAWLPGHIAEIIALDGFLGATWMARDTDTPEQRHWTVQYRVVDQAHLNQYLQAHAPALREDGLQRFGDKFTAHRRILTVMEEF